MINTFVNNTVNNPADGIIRMTRQQKTKPYRPTVSARIPEKLKERLLEKHPNDGDLSRLISILLQKYVEGRIFGIKLDSLS